MKKLPPLKKQILPENHAGYLELWSMERDMDLEAHEVGLSEVIDVDNGEARCSLPKPMECDLDPAILGEIRLLHPDLLPDTSEPLYVAVISEWRPLGVLVAPFSRYATPAFDGEYLTRREEGILRTLCVWNSVSLPRKALERSWTVGQLSEQDCSEARTLFRYVALGEELPATLQSRIGAPICSTSDPRIQYQWEEEERVAHLLALQMHIETSAKERLGDIVAMADMWIEKIPNVEKYLDQLPMAAATQETCPLWVFENPGDPEPSHILPATSDERFELDPEKRSLPSVVWKFDAPGGETFAKAPVCLLHLADKKVIAEGLVDETGRYIRLTGLCGDQLPKIRGSEQLVILVYRQ
ncbi:MAG: hypothetical protein JJU29_12725 [Verrucomicrobia bacterium]|nr:hypothetical protein [Verrucomicrobiota bacterium]MCH8512639.1 hypothetical protein [Kiritimatiellia bacterium]